MKKIKILLTILVMGVAAMAIPFLKDMWRENKDEKEQQKIEQQIEEIVNEADNEVGNNECDVAVNEKLKETKVKKLQGKNEDVIGYVDIPGTSIKYPVMQTKDNPDYYLNHDINKNYSSYGTPYLSAYCDIMTSDQLIIYGHNMGRGRMFGALTSFSDKAFLDQHPIIIFETKKHKYKYEIFAVMSVNANEFQYWGFTMARDEDDFDAYTQKVVESSTVVAGRMPKYGEQLLALSTCDNGKGKNWRFVVLGRKV